MKKRLNVHIGQEFTHPGTGHRHRITDVGTRTFAAINLDDASPGETFAGPPYAVPEYVWDEYDRQALADVPELWIDVHSSLCTLVTDGGPCEKKLKRANMPEGAEFDGGHAASLPCQHGSRNPQKCSACFSALCKAVCGAEHTGACWAFVACLPDGDPDVVYVVFHYNHHVGIFTDYDATVEAVKKRYGGGDSLKLGSPSLRGIVISSFPLNAFAERA